MTDNLKKNIAMTLLIGSLLCWAAVVQAAVPGQVSYQGMLTDDVGMPLEGTYSVHFYLYDAVGTLVWDEQQSVVVTDGIYNVQLGAVNPLGASVFSGGQAYLGVAIYNAATTSWEDLSPRQRLTSTAYAFQAENAQTLEGQAGAAFAPAAHQHAGADIASGTVDEARIDPDIARDSEISWSNLSGIPADIADGDQVGIIAETDPTITDPSVKDGVSWGELSDIPAGFADGVDNNSGGDITGVTAGTGLTGGGAVGNVSIAVAVPLSLSGAATDGLISASNTNTNGYGIYGAASGTTGYGVYGYASGPLGYGVSGVAEGVDGKGIYGYASNSGDVANYGGYFQADGKYGMGIYGVSMGSDSFGVIGVSTGSNGIGVSGAAMDPGNFLNYGGYFTAAGAHGTGVYGFASNSGGSGNYGGYFAAAGTSGRGVYGYCGGTNGRGVYGQATGTSGIAVTGIANGSEGFGVYAQAMGTDGTGVFGFASHPGDGVSYGGHFQAMGTHGRGIFAEALSTEDATNYGGHFTAHGTLGRGIYAEAANDGEVRNFGGYFRARGSDGWGVYAEALGANGIGVYGKASYSSGFDFYAGGAGTNYGAFTGAHEVRFAEDMGGEILSGMIVSATGKTEKRETDDGKVSLSSTLPTVTLAQKTKDKAVLGVVVSHGPLHEDHWYEAQEGERFGVVNALGEGRVLVTDVTGRIEAGDYITTSVIRGYGQKQDDDLLHSYTLGKAIETVDWESVPETIEYHGILYKVYLIAVVYTSG